MPLKRLLVVFWLSLAALASPAASSALPEYKVKAVFLLNFLRFIEWPEAVLGQSDTISLCVLGEDPFGDYLTPLSDKKVRRHPIEVRNPPTLADTSGCHLLFTSDPKAYRTWQEQGFTDLQVTVSDLDGFCDQGGMIQFYNREGKVHFKINLSAVNKTSIRIDSQLLDFATIVGN
jgi:hypothetical protein